VKIFGMFQVVPFVLVKAYQCGFIKFALNCYFDGFVEDNKSLKKMVENCTLYCSCKHEPMTFIEIGHLALFGIYSDNVSFQNNLINLPKPMKMLSVGC
jgi:hypothetical protein